MYVPNNYLTCSRKQHLRRRFMDLVDPTCLLESCHYLVEVYNFFWTYAWTSWWRHSRCNFRRPTTARLLVKIYTLYSIQFSIRLHLISLAIHGHDRTIRRMIGHSPRRILILWNCIVRVNSIVFVLWRGHPCSHCQFSHDIRFVFSYLYILKQT